MADPVLLTTEQLTTLVQEIVKGVKPVEAQVAAVAPGIVHRELTRLKTELSKLEADAGIVVKAAPHYMDYAAFGFSVLALLAQFGHLLHF